MYFVYIIESMKDGRYYTGQTENIESRVKRHNSGRNLSTKAYLPWRLKWLKEFESRSEAVTVEKKIKKIKRRAGLEKFIQENNFRGVAQPGPVT